MTTPAPQTATELAHRVLRQHALAFAEHASQARDDTDPEHAHQARVAIRRLRAAFRVFEDVLSPEATSLRDELRWVAEQLGPVRDLDVQVERLRQTAIRLGLEDALVPYSAWLEEQRQRGLASYADASRSQRFAELLDRLSLLESPTFSEPGLPLEQEAPRRLRAAWRRLRKRAEPLGRNSDQTAFHQARIRAKRLRYTGEFFADLYGKPARRLIATTTRLQDLLGDHQDGVVSVARIHEAVQTAASAWPPETSLALGRVVQWEAQHAEMLRERVKPTYRAAEDAWKRVRRDL